MADIRLGRLFAPDVRDANFPLSAAPRKAVAVTPVRRTWRRGPVLDQGQTPECVGFSWRGWLNASPVINKGGPTPDTIYHDAQKVDEWPGENYDGTSVRAGAKVLNTDGFISAYHWAQTVDEMGEWILTQSPMVIGINWLQNMFNPDAKGFLDVSGSVAGGHAILVRGYDSKGKFFTLTNSWGSSWGKKGTCYVRQDDMKSLVFDQQGEACAAVEVKV